MHFNYLNFLYYFGITDSDIISCGFYVILGIKLMKINEMYTFKL